MHILLCCPSIEPNVKLTHISAGTDFWTYVDKELFAGLSKYYAPLKKITL
jgi:hypothetical protein